MSSQRAYVPNHPIRTTSCDLNHYHIQRQRQFAGCITPTPKLLVCDARTDLDPALSLINQFDMGQFSLCRKSEWQADSVDLSSGVMKVDSRYNDATFSLSKDRCPGVS